MTGTHGTRRLAEELELAESLPAGPIREAWLAGVTVAGWAALAGAVRHAQLGLASIRDHRYRDAIDAFGLAAEAAVEARPAAALLEAETAARRPPR